MKTVDSLIGMQAERYADVSYFPPVQAAKMDAYHAVAALEYSKSYGGYEDLLDGMPRYFQKPHSRVALEYLQEKGVTRMALGVFASARLVTGEHLVTLPWVMSREYVEQSTWVQHSAVAYEWVENLESLKVENSESIEGYGYVFSMDDARTVFVVDAERTPRIFDQPVVKRELQRTLKKLPNLEVAYGGTVVTAKTASGSRRFV